MMSFPGELDRLIAAARGWRPARMALATVIATWGSAPRPRGSHMLVHEDGRFEGSVSGGASPGRPPLRTKSEKSNPPKPMLGPLPGAGPPPGAPFSE